MSFPKWMRSVAVAILVVGGFYGVRNLTSQEAPPENLKVKAKDFELLDLQEQKVKLSNYKGKVIILNFWATWCPPCVKEIPHIDELYRTYKDKGLVVLGLSVDEGGPEAVKKFLKKTPISYPILMANREVYTIYQEYLPKEMRGGIPFTFIIDREGFIRQFFVGYQDKKTFHQAVQPFIDTTKE